MAYEPQLNTTDTQRGQRIASGPANEPIGTLLKELPGVEASIQKDSPVPGMTTTADASLKSLYDFDREIENRQASPVAEQAAAMYGPEYMTNPAIYEGSASRSMVDQGKSVSDLWDTISKFKTMEGNTLNTALGLITKLIDKKEQTRQWEEEMKLKRETSKTSPEGIRQGEINRMQTDVNNGVPFYELISRYPGLEESLVRQTYDAGPTPLKINPDTGKPYGPAIEQSRDISAPEEDKEALVDVANKTAEYLKQVDGYASKEQALKEFELYKGVMAAQGVDVEKIRQAIEAKFPPAGPQPEWVQQFLQSLLKSRVYG